MAPPLISFFKDRGYYVQKKKASEKQSNIMMMVEKPLHSLIM
jgi:hypothetical protein